MFQGNFTDSGFVIESEATDRNIAKSVALEHSSIADVFMEDVIAFLKSEGSQDSQQMESKLSRNIRTFGGKERRACN